MKKYFVVSDVHSFYTTLMNALKTAGYQKKNPEHILVVLGDLFDRGEETMKLFKFINSIPKERLILIRGNHEDLYSELLFKDFPQQHDVSNGTLKTFCSQTKYPQEYLFGSYWKKQDEETNGMYTGQFYTKPFEYWTLIRNEVQNSKVTELVIDRSRWVDYLELGPYILTHSFIPLNGYSPFEDCYNNNLRYMYEWRTKANSLDFEHSRWGCPWFNYNLGCFQFEEERGKTLVCGHWNCSDIREHLEHPYSKSSSNEIYYSKGLIAIDGGVKCIKDKCGDYKLVHKQNVLIIDENFDCFDKYGNKLNKD